MRRAATSLGALVVSLTAAMAATTAPQKHPAPPAVHAHATTAPSAAARRSVASPGLAKAHSNKNKAAPKHASGIARTVRRRSHQASIWRIHRMVRAGVLALRL